MTSICASMLSSDEFDKKAILLNIRSIQNNNNRFMPVLIGGKNVEQDHNSRYSAVGCELS